MALRSAQLARAGLLALARASAANNAASVTGTRLFAAAAEGGGGGFGKVLFGLAAVGAGAYAADRAGYINIMGNPTVSQIAASTKLLEPKKDYAAVRAAIEKAMDADYEDGSYGPVLVRLAWHASGTYDKNLGDGGSDGATMRFSPEMAWGANAGLQVARDLLEPIKRQFPWISYADLWTLAGAQAVESMGGPHIPWRPGRSDKTDGSTCVADGRLPDATQGAQHIRDIFYRMGFDDKEIVALSGAHTLGRCHTDRSGFEGPWTNAPTTFSNLYFTELVNNKWRKKRWTGPVQYEDKSGQLMMLPTDMALLWDKKFKPHVLKYAADEEAFFKDFASAFSRLLELGCNNLAAEPV